MCGFVIRLVSMTTTALYLILRFLQIFRRLDRKAALSASISGKVVSLA